MHSSPGCAVTPIHRITRSPPCACSKISVWRDGALYPLARGCRAPRRIMPELEATAPAIPFWFYRVVAGAAELGGWLRQQGARNNTARAPPLTDLAVVTRAREAGRGGADRSARPARAAVADSFFVISAWARWPHDGEVPPRRR